MQPLAERMRPQTLDDYIGQEHLIGPNAPLRKIIESGRVPSFILWGPPGVGKTTLAGIIANTLKRPFYSLSAINSGVKDIRDTIEKAKAQQFFNTPNPILFIDEIHRFSKSQQDSLLGAVEKGIVTLIGATTENPSFEVISALLSRCQVYILKPLEVQDLVRMINVAMVKDEFLKDFNVKFNSFEALVRLSGGDGRKLYNCLEIVIQQFNKEDNEIIIDDDLVINVIQQNLALYDKNGEQHYDLISAFIKSVRSSDPNGAVYYLARMLEGGEDPIFLCRRMVILAAEDIGLANANALLMANTCFQAVHQIGMPEGRIIMSQTAIYLASSPKSNSAYLAIEAALANVKNNGAFPVPLHLRNAPTQFMKNIGYGKDYLYAHGYKDNFVNIECLPEEIKGTSFYVPGENPAENKIAELIQKNWQGKYKTQN
jgi:putative ATPase